MFYFADKVLDPNRRELRAGSKLIAVEPQVFDLLEYLIRNRERVVTKDELLASVWGGRIVSESTIAVRINAARRAIGDDGDEQGLIRTLPRRGFRFVGVVHDEVAGSGSPSSVNHSNVDRCTFCRTSDGVSIALARSGKGPTVVRTATWLNHLDYEWQSPIRLPLLRFLSDRYSLVRYDGRATGLSDRDVADISFEGFGRDLQAVVEALHLDRYALFGVSQGAPIAIAHAVLFPERVTKLVLYGAYALGRNKRASENEREMAQALLAIMRQGWGDESSAFLRTFSSVYMPSGSAQQIRWFADLQRMATSPDNSVRLRVACDEIDVVDLLGSVRVPTLVLHSRRDNVVPLEEGRRVAASIPGARLITLDSENHILLEDEPAWPVFTSEIEAFLAAGGQG